MVARLFSVILNRDLTIQSDRRLSGAARFFAVFEMALIAATFPLWWGHSEFPQVPLLSFPAVTSGVLTILLMLFSGVLVGATSLKVMRKGRFPNAISALCLMTGGLLILGDQHRLQPWHWLFLLSVFWRLVIPQAELLCVLRQTISSVYVCSALSRFSASPADGIGGIITQQILFLLGIRDWDPASTSFGFLCTGMTLAELCIGIALLFHRTRRSGCVAAVALHLTLIIALGPLGLNHHMGVLLWNLCFVCVVPVLFWGKDGPCKQADAVPLRRRLAIAVTWLFPLSGLLGIADNWPSWQLYSSRPESWILFIDESDRGAMPDSMSEFIAPPAPLSEWCLVKLDRWSLDQTWSPMYPEDRFQLAVITSILEHADEGVRFRIEVSSPSVPFWWQREHRVISSRAELDSEAQRFILGTTANPSARFGLP